MDMKTFKYLHFFEPLLQKPSFTFAEAEKQGIPRHAVAYQVKKGVLIRVSKGIFRAADYEPHVEFQWENMATVAASIPQGVLCLISALCYYDLTDQIMREIWIAIPHGMFSPKRPNTRIVRMRNMLLGKKKIRIGEFSVKIFDRERCVLDAFRYLSKEIAIKALRAYLNDPALKPNYKKLGEYAKKLRVNITPYILAYTT